MLKKPVKRKAAAQHKKWVKLAADATIDYLAGYKGKLAYPADVAGALDCNIVDAATMQELNARYRGKDYTTDVLSFSHYEAAVPFGLTPDIFGEVFICYEVAVAQAKEVGHSLKNELQRLTVHGVLHLFGFDHEKGGAEAARMFRLQRLILNRL